MKFSHIITGLITSTFMLGCDSAPEKFSPSTKYSSTAKNGDVSKKPNTKGSDGAASETKNGNENADGNERANETSGETGDETETSTTGNETSGSKDPGTGGTPDTMKPDPNAPTNCASFSWNNVKKPEDALCFKSIKEAFTALPEAAKPFWILMRDSRSAQKSTLDNPRVIISAPDGSFLLGAATDPNGRKDLEVAVYDYENSQWQFAGIDFSTNPPTVEKELCKSCHGAETHPIWTRYGGWKGAFAENNFLQGDEAAFLKRAVAGSDDIPELVKLLKFRSASSYESGSRIAPATKYYSGEENSQVLNYVAMQKAAQTAVGKMLRDPAIKVSDMLAMSAEISCGSNKGTMKKFGYSIEKDLRFILEGTDRAGDMFNGRFNASVYLAAELVGRAFAKDPSLKTKLPSAAKVFEDPRYGYFTTKSLAEHTEFTAKQKVSVRNIMSDYLNAKVFTALKSSDHCSAVSSVTSGQ